MNKRQYPARPGTPHHDALAMQGMQKNVAPTHVGRHRDNTTPTSRIQAQQGDGAGSPQRLQQSHPAGASGGTNVAVDPGGDTF